MSPVDDVNEVRDGLAEVRAEIGGLKIELANLRGDLRLGMSDLNGHFTSISAGVDHVRREVEQQVGFQGELIKQHNDAIVALSKTVEKNREHAALDASAVRVGLEAQLDNVEAGLRRDIDEVEKALGRRVGDLETWQAGVRGSWKAVAVLSSVLSSVLVGGVVALFGFVLNH